LAIAAPARRFAVLVDSAGLLLLAPPPPDQASIIGTRSLII